MRLEGGREGGAIIITVDWVGLDRDQVGAYMI